MLSDFFYLLRAHGLKVSVTEWLTLMQALSLGLHNSELTTFYDTARAVLVKTEADFDKFDVAFGEYFKGIPPAITLPDELLEWLANPRVFGLIDKLLADEKWGDLTLDELFKMLEERLKEQTERHDGGDYWIGTGGISPFGNSGYSPVGIRIGGVSRNRRALAVAGDRAYRDFREDTTLDDTQFQLAFRRLRQLSRNDEGPMDELKLPETIDATCKNAGYLNLVFGRPRRNTIKLLMLFDCGGSMSPYARLCSSLFSAVNKVNRFKDMKTYYFHNCIYQTMFTTPECNYGKTLETEDMLRRYGPEYKVIFVGDASMANYELFRKRGSTRFTNMEPGIEWLKRCVDRYNKLVWLNPLPQSEWVDNYDSYTITVIRDLIKMYPLTVKGLEDALKYLMRAR